MITTKIVETDDYILDFENLKIKVKGLDTWEYTSIEVLTELTRLYWRDEKRSSVYNRRTLSYNKVLTNEDDTEFIDTFEDITKVPDNLFFKKYNSTVIKQALNSLPVDKRNLILDYYYKDLSYTQIGSNYNMSRQRITYNINKALGLMKDYCVTNKLLTEAEFEL